VSDSSQYGREVVAGLSDAFPLVEAVGRFRPVPSGGLRLPQGIELSERVLQYRQSRTDRRNRWSSNRCSRWAERCMIALSISPRARASIPLERRGNPALPLTTGQNCYI